MLTVLRKMRHGPLRRHAGLWRSLGNGYRRWQARTGWPHSVRRKIGPFGPFRLNARFAFSNFDHWGEAHNSAFAACVEACRNATCVLDIGAHIGLVSLPASGMVAPGGRVFAFEPASGNLAFLRDHKALNGLANLEIVDSLVGETDAEDVPFFEHTGDSGLNSVVGEGKSKDFRRSLRRQVSLDTFCSMENLIPDIVKIDVEGNELSVLRGGARMFRSARPRVFLSVHPRQIGLLGGGVEELGRLIADLGYEARDTRGVPVHQFEFREYVLYPMDRG